MSDRRPFTKLDSTITESSIWFQPDHVLRVWIVLMTKRDYRTGIYRKTLLTLAREAGKSVEETQDALRILMAPDPYSRTKAHEGRRIREAEGGWQLLNHDEWVRFEAEDAERERKRKWAEEKRQRSLRVDGESSLPSTSSESEPEVANVDALRDLPSTDLRSSDPDPDSEQPPCLPDVPGLLKPSRRERGEDRLPGAIPTIRYKFRKDWKPKQMHRDRGQELGLTDEEILERAEDCRRKLHKQGFDSEDDHFMRELTWARNDKETKNARGKSGRVDERPGADRGRDPATAFGRLGHGGCE